MNFLSHNYGLVVGAIAGFLIFSWVGLFVGGALGIIYDRKPFFVLMGIKKPEVEAWFQRKFSKIG